MDGEFTRVIANGTVAAPYGTFRAHVVVAGERIAAFSDDDGCRPRPPRPPGTRGRLPSTPGPPPAAEPPTGRTTARPRPSRPSAGPAVPCRAGWPAGP